MQGLWNELNKTPDYSKIKVPERRHRIKDGEKESEYQLNEKTVNTDIKEEVTNYVKDNIDLMRELRRNRITDNQAIEKATQLASTLDDGKILSIRRGETMPIEEHLAT